VGGLSKTLFYRVFDGRQSCNDALVHKIRVMKPEAMLDAYGGIRYLAILHGNVEVDPDQHSFAFEVNISN
jgi:hypothetical protein